MINSQSSLIQDPQTNPFTQKLELINPAQASSIEIFKPSNTKCVKEAEAFLVCIQKNCRIPNPFICYERKCECVQVHKRCDQKRLQVILQNAQQMLDQKQSTQKTITQIMDQITDKISTQCENILFKLKQKNPTDSSNEKQTDELNFLNKAIFNNSLTGQLIYRIFNTEKMEKSKVENFDMILKLKKMAKEFKEDQLQKFIKNVNNLVINHQIKSNLYWLPDYKAEGLQVINQTRIKCVKSKLFHPQLALIGPSLNKIHSEPSLQKWKLKIIKAEGSIRIGGCTKLFAQQNDFHYNSETFQKKIGLFTASKFQKQSKNAKFMTNDIISVTLESSTQNLIFEHLREGTSKQIKIRYPTENWTDDDQYCIAIQLQDQGDEIEILLPFSKEKKKTNIFESSSPQSNRHIFSIKNIFAKQ